MKRFYFLFTALTLFSIVFASCTSKADNMSYESAVGRIQGKWTIEEVSLLDNKKMFKTDLTEQYKGFTFDFKYDNTLEVYDAREDKTLYGSWYLDENWVWDDDDQEYDVEYGISSLVYDLSDTAQYRQMYWKDLRIGNSKMQVIEKRYADDGKRHKYEFKLRR